MDEKNAVRSFVARLLQKKGDCGEFSDDDSLVFSGRLDSVDVIELLSFLEQRYGVDFGDRPFDQGMIDSVNEIASVIASARMV